MRKLLSYLFIFLMFLNVMGYYWILTGMQFHSVQSFESRLDADNYKETETVTFKFHLAVPYFTNQDFERAEGQFEYNGEYYHLVKKSYANDTLQLVCVKNHDSKRIGTALGDFVKTFADQPTNTGKSVQEISTLIKDYVSQQFSISHSSEGWTSTLCFSQQPSTGKPIAFHTTVTQPPEVA
jgi:hypothetical protein